MARFKRTIRDGKHIELQGSRTGKETKTSTWRVLTGTFDDEARQLRARAGGRIEDKRGSTVRIAVSPNVGLQEGRFYASLPTQHTFKTPVYVNADFYPSSDRKRILLDDDYQGEWNRSAIVTSARTIAGAVDQLCDLLPSDRFWMLLDGINKTYKEVRVGADDSVLREFWTALVPIARSRPIVASAAGPRIRPSDGLLLQNIREEREAIGVLVDLGIPLVQPELVPYRNLLLEFGCSELTLSNLMGALERRGLSGAPLPLSRAPNFMQTKGSRDALVRELARLHKRPGGTHDDRLRTRCCVLLSTDGHVAPPSALRHSGKSERRLFGTGTDEVKFYSHDNDAALKDQVRDFSVADAVKCLSAQTRDDLQRRHRADQRWVEDFASWLDSRRLELLRDRSLAQQLAAIPIWPSSDGLHTLPELSVPGDFRDPLQLATTVHSQLTRYRDLLINVLGASVLTIDIYARLHVPRAFGAVRTPDGKVVRELLRVLAEHYGQLRKSERAREALAKCPLAECADGTCRRPSQVYFDNELVRSVFGQKVSIVAPEVQKLHGAITELLHWLGVEQQLRPADIVARVHHLVSNPPRDDSKEELDRLVAAIGQNWPEFSRQTEHLGVLKSLTWLPAEGSAEWHLPSSLAAVHQRHLFDTQADFVDLKVSTQRSAAEFFDFLGVQSTPTVDQVVDHLIVCAQRKTRVHSQVYSFLNQSASNPSLSRLRDRPCILVNEQDAEGHSLYSYEVPRRVFSDGHDLGRYRRVLDAGWHPLSGFLQAVGVKQRPTAQDAIDVLAEIAETYEDEAERPLHDEDRIVVLNCWRIVSSALEADAIRPGLLHILESVPSVPTRTGRLARPDSVLFDDRPWLSRLFGADLERHTVPRYEGAWLAMQSAGVRDLSAVVTSQLTDLEIKGPSEAIRRRLMERATTLARVFASTMELDLQEVLRNILNLTAEETTRLTVVHRVPPFEPFIAGFAETPEAWIEGEAGRMFVRTGAPRIWTSIARQLAIWLAPTSNISQVTPALRDVLAAETDVEAEQLLDELGFASIDISTRVNGPAPPPVPFPGGPDEVAPSPPSPPRAPGVIDPGTGPATGPPGGRSQADTPGTGALGPPLSGRSPTPSEPKTAATRTKVEIRARSYVVHPNAAATQPGGEAVSMEVANAGMRCAVQYEYAHGRRPQQMPHNHPGYDIESRCDDETRIERFIEVKAISGEWTGYGVFLTDTQFDRGRELGDRYWLYVVENTAGNTPKLFAFQNPANKPSEFRFDDGWRQFADESNTQQ